MFAISATLLISSIIALFGVDNPLYTGQFCVRNWAIANFTDKISIRHINRKKVNSGLYEECRKSVPDYNDNDRSGHITDQTSNEKVADHQD